MVFSSLSFIFCILPLFLALDILARSINSLPLRNTVLLFVSLLFYTWGEVGHVFILFGLGVVNYIAGKCIHLAKRPGIFLTIAVVGNLFILFLYKYAYWLVSLVMPDLVMQKISMPLGISFFTFHAVSYLFDVYRRHIDPARSAFEFLTYFCMFPHLVAGPIVRYAQIKKELCSRGPDKELFAFGVYRFLLGLNKKIIIANSVAILADSAFKMSSGGELGSVDAWLGIMAYTIQIYFDFSAYSDMAIGLAAMAGFRFTENFNRPYSSLTIREFWRRWHISLSSWFRDYLFIPLGGSKEGAFTAYRNLLIVFVLCGLWHGAELSFVLWGLWHGAFLILERLRPGKYLSALPHSMQRMYTMLVVLVGWVFFRADTIGDAWNYLQSMLFLNCKPVLLVYHSKACIALIFGIFMCWLPVRIISLPTSHTANVFSVIAFCSQAALAVFSIMVLLTTDRNPFIYFNF